MKSNVSHSFSYRLGGSILCLWRSPSTRACSWSRFTLFSFYSASRIHLAPLARPFSKGLLMERIHSLFFSFHSASRIHPAPLARPFSKGLLMERIHSLFFSFHSASRIHPAPLARPFSKGLLMERIHSLFFSFHSASRIHPVPLTRPFSKSQPPTPPKGKEPAFADSFPRSCFQP